jgi:hypothetical protein
VTERDCTRQISEELDEMVTLWSSDFTKEFTSKHEGHFDLTQNLNRFTERQFAQSVPSEQGPTNDFDVSGVIDVELDNTGTRDRIGLAVWESLQSAFNPRSQHFEWPVLLSGAGTLKPNSTWNASAFKHAVPDSTVRLFRFKGAAYLGSHWQPFAAEHSHEIWRLTPKGQQRVCQFTTGQTSGHEVVRVAD